jgi:AcrR family transcriptional regulator
LHGHVLHKRISRPECSIVMHALYENHRSEFNAIRVLMSKPRATAVATVSRAPKQDRSRASFERVIDAAARLMEEKGYSGFALSDVVTRAKVSIGSIYGRVDSKDELIRVVQQRVLSKLELEQAEMFVRVRRRGLPLGKLIAALIHEIAGYLSRNAMTLSAFMEHANVDPAIRVFGKLAYSHTLLEFKLLLMEHRSEITTDDAEHATQVCFDVVYSSLSRRFGVGHVPGHTDERDLNELVADLTAVCLAYLTSTQPRRRRGN